MGKMLMVLKVLTAAGLLLAVGLAGGLAGCRGVEKPKVSVSSVTLTEQTPEGARAELALEVFNPNRVPLPVAWARYELAVDGLGTFAFTDQPPVTLPPGGTQTIVLPAAFADGREDVARPFELTGELAYQPPGQLRELASEYRIPLPAVAFTAQGRANRVEPTDQPAQTPE